MTTTSILIHTDLSSTILWLVGALALTLAGRGRMRIDLNL
jgi:hypothetical protein